MKRSAVNLFKYLSVSLILFCVYSTAKARGPFKRSGVSSSQSYSQPRGIVRYRKNYSCLERYRRFISRGMFKGKYKRVYKMFLNNSKEQNDLISFAAKHRNFSTDNVREIIEVGFKRGDFCSNPGKLFTDKDVENYVLSFSAQELKNKEVAQHDERVYSCQDEYIWEHVRSRAKKKRVRKGAAVAAVYAGLTGNAPVLVASLGVGLFSIFHKARASKVTKDYHLLTDDSLNTDTKKFVELFRKAMHMRGVKRSQARKMVPFQTLGHSPYSGEDSDKVAKALEQALTEGFDNGYFCSKDRLMSRSEITKYALQRYQQILDDEFDQPVVVADNAAVSGKPSQVDSFEESLLEDAEYQNIPRAILVK